MPKPAWELADIFRRYGPGYRQTHKLPVLHHQLMRAIENCRTAALGGHLEQCSQDSCSHTRNSYNSCRNRHCPKCQGPARRKWLAKRKAELLPVPYFHIVFTLPEALRPIGISAGRQGWIRCRRPRFFVPVRVLSALFRRLLLTALEAAFGQAKLQFFSELRPLQDPPAFAAYLNPLKNIPWVVHARPPFGGPERVLAYLSRYTHRVAISNDRLLGCDNGHVSFQWKDYRDGNRTKTLTLEAGEFIRRFLLHALPAGFQRIRHYGFLANARRNQNIDLCRRLLTADPTQLLPDIQPAEADEILIGQLPWCPVCGVGRMVRIQRLHPIPRVTELDSS